MNAVDTPDALSITVTLDITTNSVIIVNLIYIPYIHGIS